MTTPTPERYFSTEWPERCRLGLKFPLREFQMRDEPSMTRNDKVRRGILVEN